MYVQHIRSKRGRPLLLPQLLFWPFGPLWHSTLSGRVFRFGIQYRNGQTIHECVWAFQCLVLMSPQARRIPLLLACPSFLFLFRWLSNWIMKNFLTVSDSDSPYHHQWPHTSPHRKKNIHRQWRFNKSLLWYSDFLKFFKKECKILRNKWSTWHLYLCSLGGRKSSNAC